MLRYRRVAQAGRVDLRAVQGVLAGLQVDRAVPAGLQVDLQVVPADRVAEAEAVSEHSVKPWEPLPSRATKRTCEWRSS